MNDTHDNAADDRAMLEKLTRKRKQVMLIAGPRTCDWHEQEIEVDKGSGGRTELDSLQSLVGGLIEALPIDPARATVYLNEEGKLLGLPPTALWVSDDGSTLLDVLCGPLVVMGPVDGEGNTLGLTPEALAYVRAVVQPAVREPEMHFRVLRG